MGQVVKRKAIRTVDPVGMKAILAFLLPAISTLILAVLNEYVTIHVSSTLKAAIVGFVAAVVAAVGAWAGEPGNVMIEQRDT